MGDAHRGDDDIAFYAATIGATRLLAVADVASQTTDDDGAFPPGRYLLHIGNVGVGSTIWVAMGEFVKGGGLISIAASVPHFPMTQTGVAGIEVNILKGDNDRIAAVASPAGSANLFITLISRGA